ncbi:major facilitator superfamily domain-containing protein [Apodospora peruviana]|uniref:Efflux pump dotC n=1 Tax=Apodospora peruviana TaxID=516989 RepID=A0AAE0IRV1_9PEZI|nr:major facilitator superfamily domain-containing protein [Apodospora peruviana]
MATPTGKDDGGGASLSPTTPGSNHDRVSDISTAMTASTLQQQHDDNNTNNHHDNSYRYGHKFPTPLSAAAAAAAADEKAGIMRQQQDDQPSQPQEPPSSTDQNKNKDASSPITSSAGAPEEGRTNLETALIIMALASALFLAALDVTIVTVAIPTIAEEFQSTAGYTWIGSAYMLASAAAAPMWGKISDIWGRKPIILVAAGVFWVGSLLSAVSKNMAMLIVARAVQGVGGGGLVILVNICISDLFSMRKRGIYFGVMGMVWAVASALGPILGGVFTSKVTWRWCFYVNLPISGVGMAILAFVLKLHNPRTGVREGLAAVDWLGSLTVVGGTLMILLGLELGGVAHPWNSPTVLCLLIFGFVTAGLFALVEWKFAEFPIIPMRIVNSRQSIASLATCACQGFVFISGSYYLPLYFQAVLGASPLLSGVYALPYALSLSVVSALTGIFIKKTGKYLPCIIFGMATMTLGFGLFIDLESTLNLPKLILYQIVAGIGVGPNFQAPLIALQTMVHQRDIGSATATFAFVRQLWTAISLVIGGVVFQNGMEKQYPTLVAELGVETANLLSGHNAASNVGVVATLPGKEGDIARAAYLKSLKTMYIMYVAFAGLGLIISLFVGSRKLSKEHEEHKTGLHAMRRARDGSSSSSSSAPSDADVEGGVGRGADEEKGAARGSQGSGEKRRGKKWKSGLAFFSESN